MSKLDVTTQELFLRLGPTSRSRSAKADALFRRLRMEAADQIGDALMRAPKAVNPREALKRRAKSKSSSIKK